MEYKAKWVPEPACMFHRREISLASAGFEPQNVQPVTDLLDYTILASEFIND